LVRTEWATSGQFFLFLIPAAWYWKRFGARDFWDMRQLMKRALLIGVFMAALALGLNGLLIYWDRIFPMPIEFKEFFERLLRKGEPFGLAWDLFLLGLIPALCEEFFFRGLMQVGLCGKLGDVPGVILTAAIFACYHFNPWYLPYYFILGIIFGMIFLRMRNLGLTVLAHFINNAVGSVWYYFLG
jgi:membrane protease YdiL (CAAX protease family)